jgi:hypothetical protein
MTKTKLEFRALGAVLFLIAACNDGATVVDYRPSRGFSADIAASQNAGATSMRRGRTTEGEPVSAMPWFDLRHQGE